MLQEILTLRGREFGLEGLIEAVNRQIGRAGLTADDDRVSEQLDVRTVRYYQTLGLLRKPVRYDGRQAVYDYQHLLQLLTIKVLQTQGLSLSQIQGWLPAQSMESLEAGLMKHLAQPTPERVLGEFHASPRPPVAIREARTRAPAPEAPPRPSQPPTSTELRAYRLVPGVELLLDPGEVVDPDDLARRLKILLEEMF